jgi:DNA-binding Lrp family transcriptional regulator
MSVDPLLRYQGDFVPVLQTDIDLAAVQMGAEERHLFSRIDGRTTVRELSSLLGTNPMSVARGLLRLEAQGVIDRPDGSAALSDEETAALVSVDETQTDSETPAAVARRVNTVHEADLIGVGRYAGFRFPREPLEEVNDLPMALRKELIWCDRHQDLDGFALFDVSHRSDSKTIRRAVNNKLKLFHPDTYFEHDLGSFGPVILRHAARLSRVAEVMLNDASRDELKDQLLAKGEIKEVVDPAVKAERERMAKALKARRMRKNPMFRRIAQAKQIYSEAMVAAEQKQFVKAYNSILTARTFDPNNPTYREMEERFERRASDERAERHIKAADFNEGVGRWDRAAVAYMHAAKTAPHRPEFWAKAAAMLLRVGEDLKTASEMVDRALEQESDNAAFLRIQLDIFDAAEMHAKAARTAQKILQVDPTAADVAERLRKAKRGA